MTGITAVDLEYMTLIENGIRVTKLGWLSHTSTTPLLIPNLTTKDGRWLSRTSVVKYTGLIDTRVLVRADIDGVSFWNVFSQCFYENALTLSLWHYQGDSHTTLAIDNWRVSTTARKKQHQSYNNMLKKK